ncbi:MAG: DsbA family protein [Alphaproteobacteria bacterium]
MTEPTTPKKKWLPRLVGYIFRWGMISIFVATISALTMAGLFHIMLKNTIEKYPNMVLQALEAARKNNLANPSTSGLLENPSPVIKSIYDNIIADKRNGFFGNPSGKKILVEFFDYNCSYCKQQLAVLQQWVKADRDAKIILVELPILSQSSVDAAFMSILTYWLADKSQNHHITNYQKLHQNIFAAARPLSRQRLQQLARGVGFNFKLVTASDQKRARVFLENNINHANQLRIAGTPSFIYGDRLYSGFIDLTTLQKITQP